MKLAHIPASIQYTFKHSEYNFLSTGDIYRFQSGNIALNCFTGSKKEGSANNLWLRIHEENGISSYPLLGIASASQLSRSGHTLKYTGEAGGVSYEVLFRPCDRLWFWDVRLNGTGRTVDIIYGQDIGIADIDALLENELYASQYLGHTILEDAHGFHVASRQNLSQSGSFPCLFQGMINGKAIGYSTDALQFFGRSYKDTSTPAALLGGLENKNLQFENSYIALQSEAIALNQTAELTFYCCFLENREDAVGSLEDMDTILSAYASLPPHEPCIRLPKVRVRPQFGKPYSSPEFDPAAVESMYPNRILEEKSGETLLSFFLPDCTHVVLKKKELLTDRPHGNIVTTLADTAKVDRCLMTSTNYMYGLFNCQTVIGNTSKHKFLSASRGLLGLQKSSGQRIWVSLCGSYRLLALPGLFEAGLNYSRWYYRLGDDTLQITAFAVSNEKKIVTEMTSLSGIPYDFIVTNQLVMGTHEFTVPIVVQQTGRILRFFPEHPNDTPYPVWRYELEVTDADYTWSDDRIFFEDSMPQNGTLLSLSIHEASHVQIVISGFLEEEDMELSGQASASSRAAIDFDREVCQYQEYYNQFLCGFYLEKQGIVQKELQNLNVLVKWYAHNALVHYAVPHGLEQPGGAAWGTRDICQGPMEFFYAAQKFDLMRDVLEHVFAHQSKQSGEWPQWFMFDRYRDCQEDCHGDVVFWPLKCVGDYIACTGDYSILSVRLPFWDSNREEAMPILEHIKLAVASVESRFLKDTCLISYGGGDWDDTLQPVNDSLKKRLVSSWTQALAYQVLTLLQQTLEEYDPPYSAHLKQLANGVRKAFMQYLIIDGVIAGFVFDAGHGSFSPMLHPKDTVTGIHLRLIPLTRSILSGIADRELAERSLKLIENRLHFPDGVRLMDRPAAYSGGVSRLFMRAEQAANVGREISLQYVHAHIRYIEALCRLGEADLAWNALFEINPICLKDRVPNAALRQSNLYFSSSDGAFYDRYEYETGFGRLYDGSVAVKGGWRIYSSGPGIYINRLICDILGIRILQNCLCIDPVLPPSLDGLKFHYSVFGDSHVFIYHIGMEKEEPLRVVQNGRQLSARPVSGAYRAGGVLVDREAISAGCREIHIYMCLQPPGMTI